MSDLLMGDIRQAIAEGMRFHRHQVVDEIPRCDLASREYEWAHIALSVLAAFSRLYGLGNGTPADNRAFLAECNISEEMAVYLLISEEDPFGVY